MKSEITYQQLFTIMHVKPIEYRSSTEEDGWHSLSNNQQVLSKTIPDEPMAFKCACNRCNATIEITSNSALTITSCSCTTELFKTQQSPDIERPLLASPPVFIFSSILEVYDLYTKLDKTQPSFEENKKPKITLERVLK